MSPITKTGSDVVNLTFSLNNTTPLQRISEPLFDRHGVQVFVKREDLLHPIVSGNKWHKLKYNIRQARQDGYRTLLSFGGAYSNHLHALAYVGRKEGFQTVGIIRGEPREPLNETLRFVTEQGMILDYVSRADYRQKTSESFLRKFLDKFGRSYILPEGGGNQLAVKGCSEIISSVTIPFDVMCCACGTGGTLAGLIVGLKEGQRALGFSVLKANGLHRRDVRAFLSEWPVTSHSNWDVCEAYHLGGYAKVPSALRNFIVKFEEKHGIPIEPIYTGKMFYGLYDLIRKGYFKQGETIVALHSGGLQGRLSALPD